MKRYIVTQLLTVTLTSFNLAKCFVLVNYSAIYYLYT